MSQKTFPRVTKIFKYVYTLHIKTNCELISCRFFWKCIFKITCSGKVHLLNVSINIYKFIRMDSVVSKDYQIMRDLLWQCQQTSKCRLRWFNVANYEQDCSLIFWSRILGPVYSNLLHCKYLQPIEFPLAQHVVHKKYDGFYLKKCKLISVIYYST